MKITYDPKVDAAYIQFKTKKEDVTTIRLSEDIAVDFGPNEEIWGIEILDASKHLGLNGRTRSSRLTCRVRVVRPPIRSRPVQV